MTEHDDRKEVRRLLAEWAETPSPMSDAIEQAMLNAPMPNPDGTPAHGQETDPARFVDIADRMRPHAVVTLDDDGRIKTVRHRDEDY